MEELNNKTISGHIIVLVDYVRVYPPEYYVKKRGRKPSITSYTLDKNRVDSIQKVVVESANIQRDSIDLDQVKLVTKLNYRSMDNKTTGVLKLPPDETYVEIAKDIYVPNTYMYLENQILSKLDE